MYIAPLLVIFLSLTLGVTLIAYGRVVRELKKAKSEHEVYEARGRFRAEQLVQEARDKAVQILQGAQINAGQSQKAIDSELQKITQMQLDNYKDMIQKITISIEDEAKQQVDDFKKELEAQAGDVKQSVVKRVEEDYIEAKKEVEAYKADKLKQVDSQVLVVLREVSKKLLPRTIDYDMHRQMVVEALEEAKKEHVFG